MVGGRQRKGWLGKEGGRERGEKKKRKKKLLVQQVDYKIGLFWEDTP